MASADDVRRIVNTLPATTQDGSGFAINNKAIAWFYREKVEGQRERVERTDVLAVRVANADEKQMLLAADTEKFFTTPHYNGYPAVLVRLPVIDIEELTELLTDAWRIRASRKLLAEFDAQAKRKKDNPEP